MSDPAATPDAARPIELVHPDYPRISSIVPDVADYPAEITVDMAEDICSVLYEFVGHLGSDVGEAGYEYGLVRRAGRLARELQGAIIASVRRDDLRNASSER